MNRVRPALGGVRRRMRLSRRHHVPDTGGESSPVVTAQRVELIHGLLFAGGLVLFVAGLTVVIGVPGGTPVTGAGTNSTSTDVPDPSPSPHRTAPTTSTPTPTRSSDRSTSTTATTRTDTTARTPTPTRTPSRTATPTPNRTSTPTRTATPTPGRTPTRTATSTPTGNVSADILMFAPERGTYTVGQTVNARVTVRNTGTTKHTFFVGYSVITPNGTQHHNSGTTGRRVTLDPGERGTVTVGWTVPPDAPEGTYDTLTIVWKETNRSRLHTPLDRVLVADTFEVVGSEPGTSTDGGD